MARFALAATLRRDAPMGSTLRTRVGVLAAEGPDEARRLFLAQLSADNLGFETASMAVTEVCDPA